jgi:hypothetical protein
MQNLTRELRMYKNEAPTEQYNIATWPHVIEQRQQQK